MRLAKKFNITERYKVEVSGDAFNLFNHVNATGETNLGYFVNTGTITTPTGTVTCSLAAPCLSLNTNSKTFSNVFGTITNANSNFAYSSRQIQLGVRFQF